MFSKACEYGIRATVYIAQESLSGNRTSLKVIAKEIDSPEAFTAKILQQLARHNLILSTKGPHGGFEIAPENLYHLTLDKIVKSIDGDEIYQGCGLGLKACDADNPCPLHFQFLEVRNKLSLMLHTTKIHEMAEGIVDGSAFLRR
tara:strand:- start:233 stop:667 length:435 start_codon:yes stop_codon:yes gene_type:complete